MPTPGRKNMNGKIRLRHVSGNDSISRFVVPNSAAIPPTPQTMATIALTMLALVLPRRYRKPNQRSAMTTARPTSARTNCPGFQPLAAADDAGRFSASRVCWIIFDLLYAGRTAAWGSLDEPLTCEFVEIAASDDLPARRPCPGRRTVLRPPAW